MPSFTELLELYGEEPAKLISELAVDTKDDRDPDAYRQEYDGERTRRTKSVGNRIDKTVDVFEEKNGEQIKTGSKTIFVSKLSFPFPKKIVSTAVHFLFGGKMILSSEDTNEAFDHFSNVWQKTLKMQSKLKKLARDCMIETKAALYFYPQPTEIDGKKALKLRCMNLNKDNGEFYPHFDNYGDMDAFLRKYTVRVEGKDVEFAEIYTKDNSIKLKKDGGSWIHEKMDKNLFGIIPVVYVEQKQPEWESVASLIDNFENRSSRLADTNDYFAEPLLKIYGNVTKAPGKDEVGKMLEFEMKEDADGKITHGDANYATWDHVPEAIKLDLDNSWMGIFSMTSTPDLTFDNIKGIGNVSGIALKLMFMDALIKREEKGEIFFDALSRAVSVVVAGITGYTSIKFKNSLNRDDIDISFTDQLPSDLKELVDTLTLATAGSPILSQESAVSKSSLTNNPKEEITRIREESKTKLPNEQFM